MMMDSSSADDALNEALSMLEDSLTGDNNNNNNNSGGAGNNDNNDIFAIDSDDDDDDDDYDNFNFDDELNQLEGINLDDNEQQEAVISTTNNSMTAAPSVVPSSSSSSSTGGAVVVVNNNEDNELSIQSIQPTVENDISGSSFLPAKEESPLLFHPLQDIPTTIPSSSTPHTTTTTGAIMEENYRTSSSSSSSWTLNLSTNLASLAKVATASIQSAVESAEATLIHHHHLQSTMEQPSLNSIGGGGGGQISTAAPPTTTPTTTVAGQKSATPSMTYQERQRLLHQKYHAANNNNNNVVGNNYYAANVNTTIIPQQQQQQQQSSINLMKKTTHTTSRPPPSRTAIIAPSSSISSTTHDTNTNVSTLDPTAATVSTPVATAATTTTTTTAAPIGTTTTTSFLDKLTTHLDSSTKNTLLHQALGSGGGNNSTNNNCLLPGERIIMFINNLHDVKDSRYEHVFVGDHQGMMMSGAMRDCLLEGVVHDDSNGSGGGSSKKDGEEGVTTATTMTTTTVWCCVMTFYRVILFSYEVGSEDGKVLLNGNNDNDGGGGGGGGGEDESSANNYYHVVKEGGGGGWSRSKETTTTIQQWLKSRNVSVQFQAAHCPQGSNNRAAPFGRRKHHVFQMPLASIERVEKVLSSSQSSVLNSSTIGVGSGGGGGGYSSYTSTLLPSSNAVSSASSAMTQLGNQMKPLTGLVAGIAANSGGNSGASSNNNLLMDTGSNNGGPSSSSGLLATSGPLGIIIHGKDGGRWIKFSTSSYTDAARAHEALNTYAFPGRRNLGYLFAFESRRTEVMASSGAGGGQQQQMMGNTGEGGNPIAAATPPTRRRFIAMEEFTRQGIIKGGSGGGGGVAQQLSPWTVIHANMKNYGLCSTYPSVLVVPRSIVGNDDGNNLDGSGMGILRRCAAFRSENRFPVLTWGSSEHGGSIWRSSQPKVGLQGYRSAEDERYLYAIGEEAKRANLAADARAEGGVGSGSSVGRHPKEFLRMLCGRNNESDLIMEGSNSSCMLKIMDMRPKSAAMANRTQGYGYENTNYYRGSTINFYGIGNIHAVRDAYQKVNALCLNPNTSDIQWMQLVENTNWPSMTRLILSASWQTAFHVHYNRLPILLHCSHGWDRTSQVSALAQLLLDPHYRTREGFSALVEKDFLSFGHPFHTRCGHGEGKNEQGGDEGQLSPIFLQFLDCVFQLVNQFPNYFEFNARYLLLLSENIYSCRFGTLLCDSEREREVVAGIRQRTYCMWEYLDSIPDLVNPLFDNTLNNDAGVLMMPLPMLLRNVTLWTDRLCMYGAKATTPCMPQGIELDWNSTLHTAVDETADSFQRAMADMQMWKETALAALKEVDELKKKISKNERENE